MKKLLILTLLLPALLSAQETSLADFIEGFNEPGNAWRGKPFWSWNGELEKDELVRQVHIMKEMGIGGFFMHSRTGVSVLPTTLHREISGVLL